MRNRTPINLSETLVLVGALPPAAAQRPTLLKGALPPNTILSDVRQFDGERVAVVGRPYDGTKEHALSVAADLARHVVLRYCDGTGPTDVSKSASGIYRTDGRGDVVGYLEFDKDIFAAVRKGAATTDELLLKGDLGAKKPVRPEGFDVGKLPEDHARYFHIGADTHVVPMDKITPIRARSEGIHNGEYFMHQALHGKMGRRAPISLEHQGDGTYRVMDGNSTFAVAHKHGWGSIAATVHEKGQWVDPKAGLHKAAGGNIPASEHDYVHDLAETFGTTTNPKQAGLISQSGVMIPRKASPISMLRIAHERIYGTPLDNPARALQEAGLANPQHTRDHSVLHAAAPISDAQRAAFHASRTAGKGVGIVMHRGHSDLAHPKAKQFDPEGEESVYDRYHPSPDASHVDAMIDEANEAHRSQSLLQKSASPPDFLPSVPPSAPSAYRAEQHLTAAQQHLASGPLATKEFTHREMTLPHDDAVRQHTDNKDVLYHHAGQHKEWMDHVIDRGQGVSAKLGLHVVDGHSPTEEDYQEAHRKGGMVVMAPLKGEKRAGEKAAQKGWSGMRDLSRATIAVAHPDDIAHVMHHVRQSGGNIAARPDYKRTDAGYQDITVRPRHPETGHVGELQVMPLDMMQAKENGLGAEHPTSGHKLYDELREMKPEERETPEGRAKYERANQQSNALYGEAVKRMDSRTPRFANALAKALERYRERRQRHFVSPALHHGGHHPLRAGFYSYDGVPAVRMTQSGSPRYWHGGEWKHVPDLGEFDHAARRISHDEFERLRKSHNASAVYSH